MVEDDPHTRSLLCDVVRGEGFECRGCASYKDAVEAVDVLDPELVVLDFRLGDGSGRDLLVHLGRQPVFPRVVVVSGEAAGTDAFALAQLGARAFVAKPATADAVRRAIAHATHEPPDVVPLLRCLVGHVSIHEAQHLVRSTVVREAVAKARGSRSAAARLLRISRQLLQHILRGMDDGDIGALAAKHVMHVDSLHP